MGVKKAVWRMMSGKSPGSEGIIWCIDTNVLFRYARVPTGSSSQKTRLEHGQITAWLDGLMSRAAFYMMRQNYEEIRKLGARKELDGGRVDRIIAYAENFKPPYQKIKKHPDRHRLWDEGVKQIQRFREHIRDNPNLAAKRSRWFRDKNYEEMPELKEDLDVLKQAYVVKKLNPGWDVRVLSYDQDLVLWQEQAMGMLGILIVNGYNFDFLD